MKPEGLFKFAVTVNLDEGKLSFQDQTTPGKSAMSFILFDPSEPDQVSKLIGDQIIARIMHLQESVGK